MPRYDEMDDILGRVRKNLDEAVLEVETSLDRPACRPPQAAFVGPDYKVVAELVTRVLHDTEQARDLFAELSEESITLQEFETLVALTGRARKELWRCENLLGRLAPYESSESA